MTGKSEAYACTNPNVPCYKSKPACFYEHDFFNSSNNGTINWKCYDHGDHKGEHHNMYTSATISPGYVAVMYENENWNGDNIVLGPGEYMNLGQWDFNDKNKSLRILRDCTDTKYLWLEECEKHKELIFTDLDRDRKNFCNLNWTNAKSEDCQKWCKKTKNAGLCELLEMDNECKTYGLEGNCTYSSIESLKDKCAKLGIIERTSASYLGYKKINSEDKISNDDIKCIPSDIEDLMKTCRKLIPKYIENESGCTYVRIINELLRKREDEANAESIKAIQEYNELTRKKLGTMTTNYLDGYIDKTGCKEEDSACGKFVQGRRQKDETNLSELSTLVQSIKTNRKAAFNETSAYIKSVIGKDDGDTTSSGLFFDGGGGTKNMIALFFGIFMIAFVSSMMIIIFKSA